QEYGFELKMERNEQTELVELTLDYQWSFDNATSSLNAQTEVWKSKSQDNHIPQNQSLTSHKGKGIASIDVIVEPSTAATIVASSSAQKPDTSVCPGSNTNNLANEDDTIAPNYDPHQEDSVINAIRLTDTTEHEASKGLQTWT
ncbi:unnamed protein product, partial [Ilex paraguariensis]